VPPNLLPRATTAPLKCAVCAATGRAATTLTASTAAASRPALPMRR